MGLFFEVLKMNTLLQIANEYRNENPHRKGGVVLIFENKVYGWKNELRNPEDERPNSYAVDIFDNVYIASGGNDYDGSNFWKQI
jgi:hypothetical protein